jgi:hypothetical protein
MMKLNSRRRWLGLTLGISMACLAGRAAVVEVAQDDFSGGGGTIHAARQSFLALSEQPIIGVSIHLTPIRFFPSNRYLSARVLLFQSDESAQPIGEALATAVVGVSGLPSGPTPPSAFYDAYFTIPVTQTSGERYLLDVSQFFPTGEDAEAGISNLGYSIQNPYPDGLMTGLAVSPGWDLAFRTLVVPEPGVGLMCVFASTLMIWSRRMTAGKRPGSAQRPMLRNMD